MSNKIELLQSLFRELHKNNYSKIQYIPARKSMFGFFKEFENINNFFTHKKHLLFYYSILPSVYFKLITAKNETLKFLFKFCFFNQKFPEHEIVKIFGKEWVVNAIKENLLVSSEDKLHLSYSILPIYKYLIIRDHHYSYRIHEYDENKLHNRVHVGADSIKFAHYNQKILKGRRFKNTLELGCGTGIQLICFENLSDKLTGIDINPRAVSFTKMSVELNGLTGRIEVIESDLFEKLTDKFDLILANPWFIDLEKGGLEEIPDIIDKLDHFLLPGGVFAIYFSSFIKDNIDQGQTLLSKFAVEKGYDSVFYQLGCSIEPKHLKDYKKHNISHIQNYYAVLTKNGKASSKAEIITPPLMRQIRDAIYLPLQRIIGKRSSKDIV